MKQLINAVFVLITVVTSGVILGQGLIGNVNGVTEHTAIESETVLPENQEEEDIAGVDDSQPEEILDPAELPNAVQLNVSEDGTDTSDGDFHSGYMVEKNGYLYYCSEEDHALYRISISTGTSEVLITEDEEKYYPHHVLATDQYLYVARRTYNRTKMTQYTFDGKKIRDLAFAADECFFENGSFYYGPDMLYRFKLKEDPEEAELLMTVAGLDGRYTVYHGNIYYQSKLGETKKRSVDGTMESDLKETNGDIFFPVHMSLETIYDGVVYYVNDEENCITSYNLETEEKKTVLKQDGTAYYGLNRLEQGSNSLSGHMVGKNLIYFKNNDSRIYCAYDVTTGEEKELNSIIGEEWYDLQLQRIPGQTKVYYFANKAYDENRDRYFCCLDLETESVKQWKCSDIGV